MRPTLLIAIVFSIVAIPVAVLLRFAFIVPYCEVTVVKAERTNTGVIYQLRYRSSANLETADVVYRDGVPHETGSGSKSWSSNLIGVAFGNLFGEGGGSGSGMNFPEGRDREIVMPLVTGAIHRLEVGDELVLIEHRESDGTAVKQVLRVYALDYDGNRVSRQ